MGGVSGSESITINAPLDQVLAVVRDLPRQVEWFPGCISSQVLATGADGLPSRARQVNDVKVAKDEFELDYTHSDAAMSWTLVAPSKAQKDASGSWTLTPKGSGTEATLSLSIDPSLPLPGFLMKKTLGDTLKGATKALKKYCES
jgi:ribosome-associated toxin RatA of RatAB toxin-antitoxin module